MEYNFEREIPRQGTNSVKWEFEPGGEDEPLVVPSTRFLGEDRALPMWVADMDFRCPEPVVEALTARAGHGIYGYSAPTSAFYESVAGWMARRHAWEISPEWICVTPGVVPALNILVRTFVSPGEKVLIQPPVYHPFKMAIENNQAKVAVNPLRDADGEYRMDFADLEAKLDDPAVRMAILCSPHNPVGRVWTRDELAEFGRICTRNDVLVVSDEIHGDVVYPGRLFTPYAALGPDFARRSVICTSPSKSFNLAGLHTSAIIIPDGDLRSRFEKTLSSSGLFGANCFGIIAYQTAYNEGEEWLEGALRYIEANLAYLEGYLISHIPQIRMVRPQGTYLVWLDCRSLGLTSNELNHWMQEEAEVYLEDGAIFGPQGEGFQRMNIACPRALLEDALDRIRSAIARR